MGLMKKYNRKRASQSWKLTLLAVIFAVPTMAQGPIDGFFKKKNEFDVSLSAIYASASQYFAGEQLINTQMDQSIVSLYGSVGLSDRWSIVSSIPLVNFIAQDVAAYAKFKIVDKKGFTFGSALGSSFPTSRYPTESVDAIGQRAILIQPFLVAQYRIKSGWFVQGQSHYNYALNPVTSSVDGSVKLGYAGKVLYVDAWYNIQHGIGDKDYLGSVPYESFRELVTSFQRVGGVLYFNVSKMAGIFFNGSYVLICRTLMTYSPSSKLPRPARSSSSLL